MNRAEKRAQLLLRIGNKLGPEERTDFNVDRWLDSYDQDITRCSMAIDEYAQNRKALGLDDANAFDNFYTRPDIRHFCHLFPQSKLDPNWTNALDNSIVFVEMGPKDPAKTAKLIRTRQFLCAFFAWLEHMLRLVLQREKQTGRRAYAFCIFDMQNVSILQYANPFGPINKLFEMRVHLAMAYYAEMLSHVVIMNPPRFLGILFKIMSFLLPAKIIGRFHIAHSAEEAQEWIPAEAIPVGLGGKRKVEEENGDVMPNGCILGREFGHEHFLKNGTIWEKYGVDPLNWEHAVIGPGRSFVRVVQARSGQKWVYELFANRTFELDIQNDKGQYFVPLLRLCTTELSEEGEIVNEEEEDCLIRLEVKNMSRLFGMNLRIAMQFVQ